MKQKNYIIHSPLCFFIARWSKYVTMSNLNRGHLKITSSESIECAQNIKIADWKQHEQKKG